MSDLYGGLPAKRQSSRALMQQSSFVPQEVFDRLVKRGGQKVCDV